MKEELRKNIYINQLFTKVNTKYFFNKIIKTDVESALSVNVRILNIIKIDF